ncbi:uncharacterized protein LOC111267191 isoform X2 [Varroa jacobsoni]|uniref:6-pyruvoyl tetrahydrobiopterin synthase n=1 Tax=Varroa destructor TaxID=109461 RepID=A0A7M7MJ11_VARDE|nr:uncharacterized protein LOC111253723 isoform X2 [Varroa destructor]XP_022701007.1 uncharacterized protein LOC111267191 isoform X2 [Varroa jacobsoni]
MAMIKGEMSKELVVNVLQQEDGKGSHGVELAEGTEEMEDDQDNPQGSVEADSHENVEEVQQHDGAIVLAGDMSYDERLSESEEVAATGHRNSPLLGSSRYLKYKKRWRNSWLDEPEFQGWLSRNSASRNAYCIVCKRDICGSMTMIKRHARTGKHQDNVTNYSGKDQHIQHLQIQQLQYSGKQQQQQQQQQQHNSNIRYMLGTSDGSAVGTGSGEPQVVVVSEQVDSGTGNGGPDTGGGGGDGTVFVTEATEATDAEGAEGNTAFGVDGTVSLEDDYSPVDSGEVYVTICRTEQFSASHRLHCPELTPFKNQEIFGKCNNPNGHGHNYKFEVALTGPIDKTTGMVMNLADLKRLITSNVLDVVDHKNLDLDIPYFKNVVSTAENIAIFIWRQLRPVIDQKLHIRVSVFETDKNKAVFPAFI